MAVTFSNEIFDRICERIANGESLRAETAQIYALCHAETGEVRYIGKARDAQKRLETHMSDSRRRDTPLYRWIRKNGVPSVKVLIHSSLDWREDEKRTISEYRAAGARLLNVAEGGDEPFCPHHVRAQNGKVAAKQRVATPQARALYEGKKALGQMLKQGFVSDVTKAKMRDAAHRHPHIFGKWASI